jgi:flagellar protein FliO/FliZ
VLASIFGSGLPTFVQGIILAVVLFIVFVGMLLVWRSIRSGGGRTAGQGAARARQPRLGVVDVFDLDRQRQLILLRRDNVEHLIMIGGPNDVVVEQQIMRGMASRTAPSVEAILEKALQADDAPEREPHPAPDVRPGEPRLDPRQPPKQPVRSTAVPPVTAPQRNAPRPGDETVLNDMTRQLEEALKKPFAPAQNGEPPVPPQRREPVPPAPPFLTKPAANADPGQAAARGAMPSPRQPPPTPDRAAPPQGMGRAMPPPPLKEPPKEPVREPPADAKPEPTAQAPKPPPLPRAEQSINADAAKPQQPTNGPAKAEPPRPPQAAPQAVEKEIDPFSPEAIEAEFARLLGRLPSKSDG